MSVHLTVIHLRYQKMIRRGKMSCFTISANRVFRKDSFGNRISVEVLEHSLCR